MPLVSKPKSYREAGEGASGGGKKQNDRPIAVDPFDPQVKLEAGQKSKLDPEDNPFTRLAPPPKGRYQLKCFPQKDGFLQGKGRDGNVYYAANMECRIVNSTPENNGAVVFPRALYSTISRGHKISTMGAMLIKWGYGASLEKKGYELTEAEVFKLFALALKREPTIWADLDWEGRFNRGDKDNPDYTTVFNSMDDFPEDEEGNHMHIVQVSDGKGGTAEVAARLKVVEWIGKSNVVENVVKEEKVVEVEKPKVSEKKEAKVKVNGKAKQEEEVQELEEVAEAGNNVASDEDLVLDD